MTAEASELPDAMEVWITGEAAAAPGCTDSCTRAPVCSCRESPGSEGLVTPSQAMEARGTERAAAAEVMMVFCMAGVKAPEAEPEKTSDRRSTALPGGGVARGVLERDAGGVEDGVAGGVLEGEAGGVCVGVAEDDEEAVSVVVDVEEEVSEIEGVGEAVSVVVDVKEAEGVVVGVGEAVSVCVDDAEGGHWDTDTYAVAAHFPEPGGKTGEIQKLLAGHHE